MPPILRTVPALLALAGCCLTSIAQVPTGGTSTAGTSSSASSSSSTTGSSSGGTSGGTGSGTSGGTSAGTTGTSTGAPPTMVPPALLLDAGDDTIFGPVAIAAVVEPAGSGSAKLVYSVGDGGQYGVLLQTLTAGGSDLGMPTQLAVTAVEVIFSDAGPLDIFPSSPPRVAVSDDGNATAVCWEDYGVCSVGEEPLVNCATVPEDGGAGIASYSNCGNSPSLVFNPSDLGTRLFFAGLPAFTTLQEWAYGQSSAETTTLSTQGVRPSAVSLALDHEGALYVDFVDMPSSNVNGLSVAQSAYSDGGFTDASARQLEPWLESREQPLNLAAASALDGTAVDILVLENGSSSPREFVWAVGADAGGPAATLTSPTALVGAIAVGVCPDSFVNFAMTEDGRVLAVNVTFDGGLVADSSRYLQLRGFNQMAGLNRWGNDYFVSSATSLAVAPAPEGDLFVAISNPYQVGVYVIPCD